MNLNEAFLTKLFYNLSTTTPNYAKWFRKLLGEILWKTGRICCKKIEFTTSRIYKRTPSWRSGTALDCKYDDIGSDSRRTNYFIFLVW